MNGPPVELSKSGAGSFLELLCATIFSKHASNRRDQRE